MIHLRSVDSVLCGKRSYDSKTTKIKEVVTCLKCVAAQKKLIDEHGLVLCSRCDTKKPLTSFYNSCVSWCKSCKKVSKYGSTAKAIDHERGIARRKVDEVLFNRELQKEADQYLELGQ